MIQRSTSSGCTVLPCSHPHRRKPQRLSLLSSVILYVFRSHNFGHIKPLDHHRKTHLLLASKARWFSSISPPKMSGKRTQHLQPPKASNDRFSLINHQWPPPLSLSESSHRDIPKFVLFGPGSCRKSSPGVSCTCHKGFFFFYIISREFQGYFYFFLYSDTQVILWTFKGILFEFLYIYLYFCFVFFGNAPNKYKEEWQHKSNTQFIPSLYTGSKLNS